MEKFAVLCMWFRYLIDYDLELKIIEKRFKILEKAYSKIWKQSTPKKVYPLTWIHRNEGPNCLSKRKYFPILRSFRLSVCSFITLPPVLDFRLKHFNEHDSIDCDDVESILSLSLLITISLISSPPLSFVSAFRLWTNFRTTTWIYIWNEDIK